MNTIPPRHHAFSSPPPWWGRSAHSVSRVGGGLANPERERRGKAFTPSLTFGVRPEWTRGMRVLFLLFGLLSAANLRADVEVAPPPRPKGVPFVPPEPAKKENPLETVDRIIKNSKAVGDKLAMTDTGMETRGTQATILKDIELLLKQDDDSPPMGGGGQSQDKDKDKSDQKKDMQEPMGGGMPMGGMGGGGGDQQPKGGRRPRQGGKDKGDDKTQLPEGQEPKGKDMGTPGGGKDGKPDPMGGTDPKNPNPMAGATEGTPMGPAKPALPITDDVVKDVWGHLPDQLRKQVTQYYREEFMPRYSELLKQYYSSLAEKNAKPGEPKK